MLIPESPNAIQCKSVTVLKAARAALRHWELPAALNVLKRKSKCCVLKCSEKHNSSLIHNILSGKYVEAEVRHAAMHAAPYFRNFLTKVEIGKDLFLFEFNTDFIKQYFCVRNKFLKAQYVKFSFHLSS